MLDASVLVDALVVAGAAGDRARARLAAQEVLPAPALVEAEVTSAVRRLELAGEVAPAVARAARRHLAALPFELFPFAPFAVRVAELRHVVTTYDAWYVALAESLGAELVSADGRLSRATGPTCVVVAV